LQTNKKEGKVIDIHTHLLPGIDDGVQGREEAESLLADYQAAGFRYIVCTPHIANPFVKTNILGIRDAFVWFSQRAADFGITAIPGSELYIGAAKSKFIPFLDRFMLVETSTVEAPLFLLDRIFDFQLQGFTVIFAHIERFSWFSLDNPTAVRMQEMGVLFQVNVEGIQNGDAKPYIDADWVDFIASDNHGSGKRNPVNLQIFKQYPEIMKRSLRILDL
jgi:protein-tyrosine phosphatase